MSHLGYVTKYVTKYDKICPNITEYVRISHNNPKLEIRLWYILYTPAVIHTHTHYAN